jgi:hypothetical protein
LFADMPPKMALPIDEAADMPAPIQGSTVAIITPSGMKKSLIKSNISMIFAFVTNIANIRNASHLTCISAQVGQRKSRQRDVAGLCQMKKLI